MFTNIPNTVQLNMSYFSNKNGQKDFKCTKLIEMYSKILRLEQKLVLESNESLGLSKNACHAFQHFVAQFEHIQGA